MTDNIRTLLDDWKALADAATPGPWACKIAVDPLGERGTVDADMAFIAASRTIVPRLLAAIEGVQERIAITEREGHHLRLHDHTRATGTALIDAAYALRTAIRSALIGGDDGAWDCLDTFSCEIPEAGETDG